MRGRASQSLQDHFDHPIQILQYVIVPETQDSVAHRFQLQGSEFVVNHLLAMLATVKLHNQASIWTDEIGDVSTNFVLASELPTLKTSASQMVPKQLFGICLIDAQAACSIYIQTLHP